jgi:hypothetical protein
MTISLCASYRRDASVSILAMVYLHRQFGLIEEVLLRSLRKRFTGGCEWRVSSTLISGISLIIETNIRSNVSELSSSYAIFLFPLALFGAILAYRLYAASI